MLNNKFLIVLLLIVSSVSAHGQTTIHAFKQGSYANIVKSHKDKPFMLVFWSLDCTSCYKELKVLSRLRKEYPHVAIVLVSTDIDVPEKELVSVLSKYQLDKVEYWVFSTGSAEGLRYEIDHRWYGELPRSYLFKPSQQVKTISGLLSVEEFRAWINDKGR